MSARSDPADEQSAACEIDDDLGTDDDMEYELATAGSSELDEPSALDNLPDLLEQGEAEGETTIYYDAEEGTLRIGGANGIVLDADIEDSNDTTEEEQEDTNDDEDEEEEEEEGSRTPQATTNEQPQRGQVQNIMITQQQFLQFLQQAGMRGFPGLLASGGSRATTRSQARRGQHVQLGDDDEAEPVDDDDDGEEDDNVGYLGWGARRSRQRRSKFTGDRYPKIPSEVGQQLMESGTFGANDHCDHSACGLPFSQTNEHKRRRISRRMLDREMGVEYRGRGRALNALASQQLIPGSKADLIINLNARCYSGQFSEDGSFFFACGQDFKVRMYDTSNPYDWKYYKTSNYYGGQWTITDASLSPDNKLLAYSSIRSQVCLANTDIGDDSDPRPLDFSDMGSGGYSSRRDAGWGGRGHAHFGIWSLRFSGDGGEIVAGTSDQSVYVYDLEAQRSILRIPAHKDDVNAVCFGDRMSPHILYSGSDDTTLKVWDRRSLASMRPAGLFLGHTEGLTYIDSKGDGRYVISNGKDQTCKLWDLRKMVSTDDGDRIHPEDYTTSFDYRFSPYDMDDHTPHPHDCSLVTFRGHRVLKTLIRCHFSPPGSTDGRYIYSGSHDGKIYVWNMDGTNASQPIDVLAATKNSRPLSDNRFNDHDYHARDSRGGVWKTIVRDCSWHPSAPVIAATSWNGWDHGLGTCTVHSWNDGADVDEVGDVRTMHGFKPDKDLALGSTPMGARVNAQLQHDERFYDTETPGSQQSARRWTLGRMGWNDDDPDEDFIT